jgi:hypothetical protein
MDRFRGQTSVPEPRGWALMSAGLIGVDGVRPAPSRAAREKSRATDSFLRWSGASLAPPASRRTSALRSARPSSDAGHHHSQDRRDAPATIVCGLITAGSRHQVWQRSGSRMARATPVRSAVCRRAAQSAHVLWRAPARSPASHPQRQHQRLPGARNDPHVASVRDPHRQSDRRSRPIPGSTRRDASHKAIMAAAPWIPCLSVGTRGLLLQIYLPAI